MIYARLALGMTAMAAVALALPSPLPRDAAPDPNVKDSTRAVIMDYLQSQNVNSSFTFTPSWTAIDFAGVNVGDSVGAGNLNAIMYQAFDHVIGPHQEQQWFSIEFTNFVEEVNKHFPEINGSHPDPQVQKAQDDQIDACHTQLNAALQKALPIYIEEVGPIATNSTPETDPSLRQWAQTNYAPLMTAQAACSSAQDGYLRAITTVYGDDSGAFAPLMTTITAMEQSLSGGEPLPGVTMPISDNFLPNQAKPPSNGKYKPEYDASVLNATLTNWQTSGSSTPAFSYKVNSSHFANESHTTEGGGGLSFIWDDFSGSGSGEGSTTTKSGNATTQYFEMTFGGISLITIDRGIWFDGFEMANAVQNPPDNITAAAKPAFDQFFGNATNPGPAASYNRQVLMAYQPTWNITFTSKTDYEEMKSASGGGEACFLFICANAHGSTSSNKTTVDDNSMTIAFQDLSKNGYILGYVVSSYWDSGRTTTIG
ncbi:hypothetical protein C8R46DRAFT_1293024 [Mycena filopes]|nr:hypothetical protein C8R46DRAFT_1293024 [Mycena filopes]